MYCTILGDVFCSCLLDAVKFFYFLQFYLVDLSFLGIYGGIIDKIFIFI